MKRPSLLSIPNLLSFSRFPLAAAFLLAGSVPVRVAVCLGASATDVLDGWLARRHGTTWWGALIDPIADKTFMLTALSVFLFEGKLSTVEYFIILSRDFATAVGFLVAYLLPTLDPKRFRARVSGKVVTILQLLAVLVILIAPRGKVWLIPAIALASILSIADYTLVLARERRDVLADGTR